MATMIFAFSDPGRTRPMNDPAYLDLQVSNSCIEGSL